MADFDFESVYSPPQQDYAPPTLPPSVMDAFIQKRKKDSTAQSIAEHLALAQTTNKNRAMMGLPPIQMTVPLSLPPEVSANMVNGQGGKVNTVPKASAAIEPSASLPPTAKTDGVTDILKHVAAKSTPAASTSVAATAPSGVQQEVQSKSALDDLMAQLAAHRQVDPEEQRRQLFLNFFSSMAKSNSPTLMGSIGEGAGTIAPTIQAQNTARDAEAEKSLEDRIKVAQYQQDYGLKARATAADELRAQAAMMSEKSNASYRASVVGALGNSGGVNSKNYAQLSTAYTRMKAADDMAGTVNPLTTQLAQRLMAFGGDASATDAPSRGRISAAGAYTPHGE